MSVSIYQVGDRFRLTIIKNHALNPLDKWANTYEFEAMSVGGIAELQLCADAFVAFEQSISFDSTIFDHYVFATWEEDSAPYNPENFMSIPIGETGDTAAPAAPVALGTCLHVLRQASFGRAGHIFYRNVLTETDVAAPGGIDVLTAIGTMNSTVQAAMTAANVFDFVGPEGIDTLRLCMINANGAQVRAVMSLVVAGVTRIKTDHKWYNRVGSP